MPVPPLEFSSILQTQLAPLVGASLVAQAPAPPPAWVQFVPLALILLIFWVVAIRPARKKQDELQQTIANLKKGDKVLTTGGIYGEVVSTDTAHLVIKIAENVKIKVTRSAIAGLQHQESGANR